MGCCGSTEEAPEPKQKSKGAIESPKAKKGAGKAKAKGTTEKKKNIQSDNEASDSGTSSSENSKEDIDANSEQELDTASSSKEKVKKAKSKKKSKKKKTKKNKSEGVELESMDSETKRAKLKAKPSIAVAIDTKRQSVDSNSLSGMARDLDNWWEKTVVTQTPQQELELFLEDNGFEEYKERLLLEGFECLDDVLEEDLEELGLSEEETKRFLLLKEELYAMKQKLTRLTTQYKSDPTRKYLLEWEFINFETPGDVMLAGRPSWDQDLAMYRTSPIEKFYFIDGTFKSWCVEMERIDDLEYVTTLSGSKYYVGIRKGQK